MLTLIVTAVALSLLFMRRRDVAAFIVGAVLTGTLLSTSLKAFFDRPRPDLTGVVTVFTSSFPSGHATVSAVAYLTLGTCLAEITDIPRLKAFYIGYAVFLTPCWAHPCLSRGPLPKRRGRRLGNRYGLGVDLRESLEPLAPGTAVMAKGLVA